MTRVKVCGVRSYEDAKMCYEEGVDAVGFISVPGRSRSVSLTKIREVISLLGPGTSTTLITLDEDPEEVIRKAEFTRPDTVQTYSLGPGEIRELRERGFGVVRAVTVDLESGKPEMTEDELFDLSRAADLILFEPSKGGKAGGMGLKYDPKKLLSQLKTKCPNFAIAGGLDPENVNQALEINPIMVDVSSGVESEKGKKDRELVREFVRRCRNDGN